MASIHGDKTGQNTPHMASIHGDETCQNTPHMASIHGDLQLTIYKPMGLVE